MLAVKLRVVPELLLMLLFTQTLLVVHKTYYVMQTPVVGAVKLLLVEPQAVEALHQWAKGIPRLVNTAADLALLAAYGEGKKRVDVAAVKAGLEEITSQTLAG